MIITELQPTFRCQTVAIILIVNIMLDLVYSNVGVIFSSLGTRGSDTSHYLSEGLDGKLKINSRTKLDLNLNGVRVASFQSWVGGGRRKRKLRFVQTLLLLFLHNSSEIHGTI